jgi:hypothetical protein
LSEIVSPESQLLRKNLRFGLLFIRALVRDSLRPASVNTVFYVAGRTKDEGNRATQNLAQFGFPRFGKTDIRVRDIALSIIFNTKISY